MDITCRLIFEEYTMSNRFKISRLNRSKSIHRDKVYFDHMDIQDLKDKTIYNIVQINDVGNKKFMSTSIFDSRYGVENHMIYHTINELLNWKDYEEFVKNFDSIHKSHSFYKDKPAGVLIVWKLLQMAKNLSESERLDIIYKMKPKTKEHFADILGGLST